MQDRTLHNPVRKKVNVRVTYDSVINAVQVATFFSENFLQPHIVWEHGTVQSGEMRSDCGTFSPRLRLRAAYLLQFKNVIPMNLLYSQFNLQSNPYKNVRFTIEETRINVSDGGGAWHHDGGSPS